MTQFKIHESIDIFHPLDVNTPPGKYISQNGSTIVYIPSRWRKDDTCMVFVRDEQPYIGRLNHFVSYDLYRKLEGKIELEF